VSYLLSWAGSRWPDSRGEEIKLVTRMNMEKGGKGDYL